MQITTYFPVQSIEGMIAMTQAGGEECGDRLEEAQLGKTRIGVRARRTL